MSGGFAQATVTELADRAGVSRATVFSRFGSKLGVLEALAVRCSGESPDAGHPGGRGHGGPRRGRARHVAASAEHWERQGHILLTLKAVSELEPGAIALVDDQRRDQREGMERLARGLEREGRLGELTRAQAAAALHMITSVESFMELRRNAGLSLAATKRVVGAMAAGLFDLERADGAALLVAVGRGDGAEGRHPHPVVAGDVLHEALEHEEGVGPGDRLRVDREGEHAARYPVVGEVEVVLPPRVQDFDRAERAAPRQLLEEREVVEVPRDGDLDDRDWAGRRSCPAPGRRSRPDGGGTPRSRGPSARSPTRSRAPPAAPAWRRRSPTPASGSPAAGARAAARARPAAGA